MKISQMATRRTPLSMFIALAAAPVQRPPAPIMPMRMTSLPWAWTPAWMARVPSAAPDATAVEVFRKLRRDASFSEPLLLSLIIASALCLLPWGCGPAPPPATGRHPTAHRPSHASAAFRRPQGGSLALLSQECAAGAFPDLRKSGNSGSARRGRLLLPRGRDRGASAVTRGCGGSVEHDEDDGDGRGRNPKNRDQAQGWTWRRTGGAAGR